MGKSEFEALRLHNDIAWYIFAPRDNAHTDDLGGDDVWYTDITPFGNLSEPYRAPKKTREFGIS